MTSFIEEHKMTLTDEFSTIIGNSVDELVKNGVYHILTTGEKISSRAGSALQAYGVNYVLKNPRNRLHHLRDGAVKYLTRELLAYFSGKLKAEEGLAKASKFWMTLTDEDGNVNSNYGYYVFYEPVENYGNQYNWVKTVLINNNDSRRAIININQNYHKSETKDFPCTVGIQFYIKDNHLFCEVMSRSTDVITGLPYDMGFFSFLHELMWKDLTESGIPNLMLGNTVMKTTFTQIYDKSLSKANIVAESTLSDRHSEMPTIESARETLADILNGSKNTYLLQWIYQHAQ
ncbi:thymidylate synthase [Erwinia persicina]|uniref:thymidylate synthase n=1 Tax=Erwinia persicina TaxID=55211 RepID=UPI000E5459D2|nr:thymidylate synthase [Erwinia persicina]AXU94711.1 thymidylate synthase [Erwinia persicina]QZQ51848.1 thymidylate synthase [Erwinia persicina]